MIGEAWIQLLPLSRRLACLTLSNGGSRSNSSLQIQQLWAHLSEHLFRVEMEDGLSWRMCRVSQGWAKPVTRLRTTWNHSIRSSVFSVRSLRVFAYIPTHISIYTNSPRSSDRVKVSNTYVWDHASGRPAFLFGKLILAPHSIHPTWWFSENHLSLGRAGKGYGRIPFAHRHMPFTRTTIVDAYKGFTENWILSQLEALLTIRTWANSITD